MPPIKGVEGILLIVSILGRLELPPSPSADHGFQAYCLSILPVSTAGEYGFVELSVLVQLTIVISLAAMISIAVIVHLSTLLQNVHLGFIKHMNSGLYKED